ncbi:MAG: sulfatase-like hydrolase/transferase [Coraliomargaritaceae bacterium]
MKQSFCLFCYCFFASLLALVAYASQESRPNIIVYFADDISAREIPAYGSTVWSNDKDGGDCSDPEMRAVTPVLDRFSNEGCLIKNAWAATICNPSRAMMLTGRYAHRTKWWNNGDRGVYVDPWGNLTAWPVYESSPILISHVAKNAGYATFWTGKTQMAGTYEAHGFDEGCFSPGRWTDLDNPNTDFRLLYEKRNGEKVLINEDTGKPVDTYKQHSWNFHPEVKLMNHPTAPNKIVWWPNTEEAKEQYGITTYGPDVELFYSLDFIERQHKAKKPFLVYHTSHLGHDAYDWLDPDSDSKWPGTPVVEWDGQGYLRKEVRISGDHGDYDTHGTVTEPGIHEHIKYIDYQLWCYLQKLEELGIADNTVIIFTADNGTSGFGKNNPTQQRGSHVPMIIYATGMTKQGHLDTMASLSDIHPTIAELVGYEMPEDYEIDGKSLVPFLFEDAPQHRRWVYAYRGPEQFIRGKYVLKDGGGKWWDVAQIPSDLTSFPEIEDWSEVPETHRAESERLLQLLPTYDFYFDEHESPGIPNRFPVKSYKRKNK